MGGRRAFVLGIGGVERMEGYRGVILRLNIVELNRLVIKAYKLVIFSVFKLLYDYNQTYYHTKLDDRRLRCYKSSKESIQIFLS
jgi:hypothetical protein